MNVRNGWRLEAHPLLLAQLGRLSQGARQAVARDPFNRRDSPDLRLLAAVRAMMFEQIPAAPMREDFRRTHPLSGQRSHWRCATVGGRFAVYFQIRADDRRIIYGWIADQNAIRRPAIKDETYVIYGAASAVTAKGKVVLPRIVREALQVPFGGRLAFWLQGSLVTVSAASPMAPMITPTDALKTTRHERALMLPHFVGYHDEPGRPLI